MRGKTSERTILTSLAAVAGLAFALLAAFSSSAWAYTNREGDYRANIYNRYPSGLSSSVTEETLKSMVNANKCIGLGWNEVPKYETPGLTACFVKEYGVSCSSVNEDCKYQPSQAQDCRQVAMDCTNNNSYECQRRLACEYSSEFWNRPMDDNGKPITYSEIASARYVVDKNANSKITSIKPIFVPRTARFEDNPVWWREVYYITNGGFNGYHQTMLTQREGQDDWIRGEIGDEGGCSQESRLGYYIYKKSSEEQIFEAEWVVPINTDEKWRKR